MDHPTRWAPTSYKYCYNSYRVKQPQLPNSFSVIYRGYFTTFTNPKCSIFTIPDSLTPPITDPERESMIHECLARKWPCQKCEMSFGSFFECNVYPFAYHPRIIFAYIYHRHQPNVSNICHTWYGFCNPRCVSVLGCLGGTTKGLHS